MSLPKVTVFNTMSRQLEELRPMVPGRVGIYTCGPTVYSYAHIGNMRSYIFADILRRTLETLGYQVNHVMNITDVGHLTDDADSGEDKMEVGCRREGLSAWDVAQKYTDAFFAHAGQLQIKKPNIVCKATDYIAEQIAMVEALESKGYTYRTKDGLYFDTARFPDYPKLARIDVAGLKEGQRVDMGEKRSKTDFALWKFSAPEEKRQMEWDSPWGRGFPGWHIECSAMSVRFLGEQFDIHTGGVDHIPIHHTNEIAQTECATGRSPFVKYWMHGEFLLIDDAEKMSKSLGNVLTVATLEERGFDPRSYRLLVLQTHYRKQLRFTMDALASAQKGLERLIHLAQRAMAESKGITEVRVSDRGQTYRTQFLEAIASDLNMPQALANLYSLAEDGELVAGEKLRLMQEQDQVFGLGLWTDLKTSDIPAPMLDFLQKRNAARTAKNWAEADRLRDEIAAKGYEILDSPQGSTLKRKL